MKKNLKNKKSIIANFENLLSLVDQSLLVFGEGVRNYLYRDIAALSGNLQGIVKIQSEVSILSRELHGALFSTSFSMGMQGDIYRLIEQMLHLVDMANNCLFQFETERPNIPSELNHDYLKLLELSTSSVQNTVEAARSFFKDTESVPEKVRRVHFFQKEADRHAKFLKKKVFQQMNELKLSEKTHLRYFALHIEELSLQAMKIADQLSVMVIRNNAGDMAYRSPYNIIYLLLPLLVTVVLVLAVSSVQQNQHLTIGIAASVVLLCFVLLLLRLRHVRRFSTDRIKAQEAEIDENNKKLSEMEMQIISMENDHLQNLLELKRKETTGIAEKITEQKDFLDTMHELVLKAQNAEDEQSRKNLLHELQTQLSLRNNFSENEDFNAKVEALHKDFAARLEARFPQLTPQERRLATLLRLEFPSKYIAGLLNISTKSVEIERHRMRKKMGLERSQNLIEFIKSI